MLTQKVNPTAQALIETWRIHERINQFLLHYMPQEGLATKHKGRSPGEHLAHIHNVRLMWLEQAAPQLLKGLQKFESKTGGTIAVKEFEAALKASGVAIEALLQLAFEAEPNVGKVKGFKPHGVAFVGYLISHESHHRGQILLNLRLGGFELDKKMTYDLWEWGVR